MKQRNLSQVEIYQKLMRYCAYQDRCSTDIVKKIKLWQLDDKVIENALSYLKEEGFVDDLRFAKSFVRGKFRSNKWGRAKIREALYAKQIQKEFVEEAMKELDEEKYDEQLLNLLIKKNRLLKEEDIYKRKQKLALYVQSKGYEMNLIWEAIKKINLKISD